MQSRRSAEPGRVLGSSQGATVHGRWPPFARLPAHQCRVCGAPDISWFPVSTVSRPSTANRQLARTLPASHPVLVHRLASLLHAFFRPHLAVRPICASLSLHLHQAVKRTFTSKLSNMLGTRQEGPKISLRAFLAVSVFAWPLFPVARSGQ